MRLGVPALLGAPVAITVWRMISDGPVRLGLRGLRRRLDPFERGVVAEVLDMPAVRLEPLPTSSLNASSVEPSIVIRLSS